MQLQVLQCLPKHGQEQSLWHVIEIVDGHDTVLVTGSLCTYVPLLLTFCQQGMIA